jgi:hypothetical protein
MYSPIANLACSNFSFFVTSKIRIGWFSGGGGTFSILSLFFKTRLKFGKKRTTQCLELFEILKF